MSDMSGNGKDEEVTPDSNSEEGKKPDLDDTLSRLLRRKAEEDGEDEGDGGDSAA